MKFRISREQAEFAERQTKRKLALDKARQELIKEKKIHCRVEKDGLHLTWGRKCVKIKPQYAIRLAHSILRHMNGT